MKENPKTEQSETPPIPRQESMFPQKLLNRGFSFALWLTGLCLLSGVAYLFFFLITSNSALNQLLGTSNPSFSEDYLGDIVFAKMFMARLSLLACGAFIGLAFGFLGFGLFLLGIRGEMDVEASHEKSNVKIARMAPGAFVILCSIILIGLCVTRKPEMSLDRDYGNTETKGSQNTSSNKSVAPIQPPTDWAKP